MRYLTSDESGRFRAALPDLRPEELVLEVAGFRSHYRRTPARLDEGPDGLSWNLGDLLLDRGCAVGLFVHAEDGHPIAGARVEHRYSTGRGGIDWEELGARTRTDAAGFWSSTGFDYRSEQCVEVAAKGFAARLVWFEPVSDTGPIPVMLERAGEIRGRLVDRSGRPISGMPLHLRGLGQQSEYLRGRGYWTRPVAVTDAGGAFRAVCPAGRWLRIGPRAMAASPLADEVLAPLAPGEMRDLGRVELLEAVRFRIVVRDESGVPVSDCRLLIPFQQVVRTDRDGTAVCTAEAAKLSIKVLDGRFIQEETGIDDVASLPRAAEDDLPVVAVTARRGLRIAGEVRRADGAAVDGGYVIVEDDHSVRAHALVGPDGRFAIEGCPPPPCKLIVSSYVQVHEMRIDDVPPDGELVIELPAPAWPELRVRLAGPDGLPLRDGRCRAFIVVPELNKYFTDEAPARQGKVVFRGLGKNLLQNYPGLELRGKPLSFELVIACDGQGGSGPLPLGSLEGITEIEVELEPFGEIVATVVDQSGEPVPGARTFYAYAPPGVESSHSPSTPLRAVYTDRDGVCRLTELPAGTYALAIEGAGCGPLAPAPVAIAFGEIKELEFTFPPGGAVEGHVVDDGGRPVPDAVVRVDLPQTREVLSRIAGRSPFDPVTDAEGRFECDSVPEGFLSGVVSGWTLDSEEFETRFACTVRPGEVTRVTVTVGR